MNSTFEKKIPVGAWLYFNRLPSDTTDVEFQEFLAVHGIDLPLENISVRQYENGSCAKVTVPNDTVSCLINWAINGDKLRGKSVLAATIVGQSQGTRREYAVMPQDGVERR